MMKKFSVFIFKSDILRNRKMLVECLWAKTVTYGHGLSLSLSLSPSVFLSLSDMHTYAHNSWSAAQMSSGKTSSCRRRKGP